MNRTLTLCHILYVCYLLFWKYGMWQMSANSYAVHEALNVLIDDPL